jgi:hypothetical protein
VFREPSAEGQEYDEDDEDDAAENSPPEATASRFATTKTTRAKLCRQRSSEAKVRERKVKERAKNEICAGVDVQLGDAVGDHDAGHARGFGRGTAVL